MERREELSEAYGAFAWAYDDALGKRFFRAARKLLTPLLALPPREKTTFNQGMRGKYRSTIERTSRGGLQCKRHESATTTPS